MTHSFLEQTPCTLNYLLPSIVAAQSEDNHGYYVCKATDFWTVVEPELALGQFMFYDWLLSLTAGLRGCAYYCKPFQSTLTGCQEAGHQLNILQQYIGLAVS